MEKRELSTQAAEERRKYKREWYAKNKEKAAQYNKRYWERKAHERKQVEKCGE